MKKFLIIFAFTILFFRNELLTGIVYLSNGVETGVKIFVQSLCDEDDACHSGNEKPTQPDDNYTNPNPDFVPSSLPNHGDEKDRSYVTPPDHSDEKNRPYIPAELQSHQPFTPNDPSFDRKPLPPSEPSFDRKPSTPDIPSSMYEPSSPVIPDCKVEDWTQFLEGIEKGTLPCR